MKLPLPSSDNSVIYISQQPLGGIKSLHAFFFFLKLHHVIHEKYGVKLCTEYLYECDSVKYGSHPLVGVNCMQFHHTWSLHSIM